MNSTVGHEFWMSRALQVARRGLYSTHPNPRVGCVIVFQNELISEGFHEITGGPHAEIQALGKITIPQNAEFYISLEPCSHQGKTPPCVDALIAAKPARVIVAMQDPNPLVAGKGIAKLKAQGIEVIVGVLERQARGLNCGFVSRMERLKPYVRLKMAMSIDGRTALGNGVSQWITGEAARKDVQYLRAKSSAILTSAKTILEDEPSLDVRLNRAELNQQCEIRQPVRVIIDSQLVLTGHEKIFQTQGEIWIFTLNENSQRQKQLSAHGVEIIVANKSGSKHVDLTVVMKELARRGINEVHTECGQRLAGGLIKQNLVDEIVLYMAPHLLGNQGRGLFDLGELTNMDERVNCQVKQIRTIGEDLRLTLNLGQK